MADMVTLTDNLFKSLVDLPYGPGCLITKGGMVGGYRNDEVVLRNFSYV